MPDILLIQPPIEDYYLTAKRTIPYGLACIASSLEAAGFSVGLLDALAVNKSRIIDPPQEMNYLKDSYGKPDISPFSLFHHYRHYGYSFQHIGTVVRETKPLIVGISSLFTPYAKEAIRTAEAVKTFYPDCKIVMGGHHATCLPEDVMACNAVDFVLRGEGEVGMPEFSRRLFNGDSLRDVPGIVLREDDGTLFIREPAWMAELESYPQPSNHLVNNLFYSRGRWASAVIVAGRGCPMRCSYCSVGASSSYARFRQRSVANIMAEMEDVMSQNDACFIDFEDENLTLNKKWFLSLMGEISNKFKGKDIELRAMNGLYPPSLDDEVVAAMKEAGFRTLNLSLGSTSAEQLSKFKRPDVRKSFENSLLLAEKFSLEAVSYIIAGAPGQDPYESLEDLLYLAGEKTLVGLSVFYPAPGSEDYGKCIEKGLLPKEFSLMRSTAIPISDTTTRLESSTLLRLSRILNFIKSLADKKMPIPEPESFNKGECFDLKDRAAVGIRLLSWFLHDGVIRGVTPNGEIYRHSADENLAGMFAEKIKTIKIGRIKPAKPAA